MSDLLFIKFYAPVFASPDLDVADEIGQLPRSAPVILLQGPTPFVGYAQVLSSFGIGWVNVNDLTADR